MKPVPAGDVALPLTEYVDRPERLLQRDLVWGNGATGLVLAAQRIQSAGANHPALSVATALLDRRPRYCLYYRTRDPRPCPDCPLVDAVVTQRLGTASGSGV